MHTGGAMEAAFDIDIDTARGRGIVTFAPATRVADLLRAGRALLAHPAWRDGFDELWDLRAVRHAGLSIREMKEILAFDAATGGGIRRTAIVVERFQLHVLAQSYARLVAPRRPIQVFATCHEAIAWLDAGP